METAEYLKDDDLLAFFNPEERRKQERLDNLTKENLALNNQITLLQQNNKRLEDKIVEILKNMFNVEQKLKGFFQTNFFSLPRKITFGKSTK